MTTIVIIGIMVVAALLGWAIAELKNKSCSYEASEEEKQSLKNWIDTLNKREREMDIDDVMATISTKGFSAV